MLATSPDLASERLRRQLQQESLCRFVNRAKFCDLLVSNLKLERADVIGARIRGLYDPETRMRYLIEEENLYRV